MYFYTNVARRGNSILCKYIENGVRKQTKIPFKPELFMSNPSATDSPMRCYKGEQILERMEFDSMREAKDFITRYEGIHGVQLHGMDDFVLQFINRAFRNEKMEIDYDFKQIRISWFDIEVSSYINGVDNGFPHADMALYPITCMAFYNAWEDVYHLFTWGHVDESKFKDHDRLKDLNIKVHRYTDEYDMMDQWLGWWGEIDADVIIGFNSERFDVPYITNRVMRIMGPDASQRLSPYGIIQERTVKSKFGESITFDWIGINMLDYIDIYKKHSFVTLRAYDLDSVADFEIGLGKLEYSEAGSLNALWSGQFRTDWYDPAHSEMSFLAKLRTAVADKLANLGETDVPFSRDDELPPDEYNATPYEVKEINYDAVNAKFDKLESITREGPRLEFIKRQRIKAIDREEYRYKMRCEIKERHDKHNRAKVETIAAINGVYRDCGDDVDLLWAKYRQLDEEVIKMCQQLYHEYNIVDVRVLPDIDKKRQLMALTARLAYTCFCNYNATLRTVKPWDALVYRYLVKKNRQPPIRVGEISKSEPYPGAYVFPIQRGKHKWVCSADASSLYPITEISTNISAEVLVDYADLPEEVQQAIPMNYDHEQFIVDLVNEKYDLSVLKKHNLSMSGFRQFFKRDEIGIFPEIKADLFAQRKGFKTLMTAEKKKIQALKAEYAAREEGKTSAPEFIGLTKDELDVLMVKAVFEESAQDTNQMSTKILLNSGYGATGQESFRYFDVRIAASITATGQVVNRTVARKVNEYLQRTLQKPEYNFIVAGDTDSFYFTLDPLVERLNLVEKGYDKFQIAEVLDMFIKTKLDGIIRSATTGVYEYMNHLQDKQNYDREVIAESAIWHAKKAYTMSVIDDEGVVQAKPKRKVMGLIAKKSSCPLWSSKFLMECYNLAMDNEDDTVIQERVQDIREAFEWMTLEEIAIPTGVNGIEIWPHPEHRNQKGRQAPHHVKAALWHNHIAAENGWKHIIPLKSGDKIKMLPLKAGNKYGIKKIAFVSYGKLPVEFDLHEDVDRLKIFNDKFIKPLQDFLDSIGWSHQRKAKVTGFIKQK